MNFGILVSVIALFFSLASLIILFYLYRKTRNTINSVQKLIEASSSYLKMKRLEKALIKKPRSRYIVFRVYSDNPVSRNDLEEALEKEFRRMLGDPAYVLASPKLIEYYPEISTGILRVRHLYKNRAIAILGSIKKINSVRTIVTPLTVTGTLKTARKRLKS